MTSNLIVIGKPPTGSPKWAESYPWTLSRKYAKKYHLDINLIIALIRVESGGRKYVARFEPGIIRYFSPGKYAQHLNQTLSTEKVQQATSFGYCQVLGRTARLLGFDGPLGQLFDPDTNLDIACQLISRDLRKRYQKEEDIIAAYNAGQAIMDGGRYKNQEYVDKVTSALRELRHAGRSNSDR